MGNRIRSVLTSIAVHKSTHVSKNGVANWSLFFLQSSYCLGAFCREGGKETRNNPPHPSPGWYSDGCLSSDQKNDGVHVKSSEGNIRDTTGRTCDFFVFFKLGCQILRSMVPRCQRLLTRIHGSLHPLTHQRSSQVLREQQHLEYPSMIW